jgi:hypothetical protein
VVGSDEVMRRELSDDAIQRIQAELFAGRKIQAVKAYRGATGVGLAEALAFINALEERLRQESPQRFTTPARQTGGCILMAACLAVILIALFMTLALLQL